MSVDSADLFLPHGADPRCLLLRSDADADAPATIAAVQQASVVLLGMPEPNPFARVRALRRIDSRCLLVQLPLYSGRSGVVDLCTDATFVPQPAGWHRIASSPDDEVKAAEYRDSLFDLIVGFSDDLGDAVLQGKPAPASMIYEALRLAIAARVVAPVLLAATSDGAACAASVDLLAAVL